VISLLGSGPPFDIINPFGVAALKNSQRYDVDPGWQVPSAEQRVNADAGRYSDLSDSAPEQLSVYRGAALENAVG
jgi:hypothetical protein